MSALPFLKKDKWPVSKETEERVVNPNHDQSLQDHLMDQLMMAMEKGDKPSIHDALLSLIKSILSEDDNGM